MTHASKRKGGLARAASLSPARRLEIAAAAAYSRWHGRKPPKPRYPLEPRFLTDAGEGDDAMWFYEDGRGIDLHIGGARHVSVVIPWRLLVAAVKNHLRKRP